MNVIEQPIQTQDSAQPATVQLTFWQVLVSVIAAAFGVQTSATRNRDFTYGRPHHFIIVGIVLTGIFVVALIVGVNWLIAHP